MIFNTLQTQTNSGARPFALGETLEIQSAIPSETRTLNVFLPPGYSPDSLKQYPVIYLLDWRCTLLLSKFSGNGVKYYPG